MGLFKFNSKDVSRKAEYTHNAGAPGQCSQFLVESGLIIYFLPLSVNMISVSVEFGLLIYFLSLSVIMISMLVESGLLIYFLSLSVIITIAVCVVVFSSLN